MSTTGAINGHTTHNITLNETDNTSLISSSSSFSSISSSHSMSFRENYFSSSSSNSSPATPLRFSGIPFSWEKLPGIPKHQIPNKKDHHHSHFLPLPPAGTPRKSVPKELNSSAGKKQFSGDCFLKDPFFAAFVECSKDENDTIGNFWKGSKVTRSFSDRLGFVNMYTSCKTSSAVSESIVYLPRSNRRSVSGRLR